MIAADRPDRASAKLLTVDADGRIRHRPRTDLAVLFDPGDLVVANDAATLPASLTGTHMPSGRPIEIRLAAWVSFPDPTRFVAVAFGDGDYRTPTESRPLPPPLGPGDRLALGPLSASVERILGHPRLVTVRFARGRAAAWAGIVSHGRPIQYAHVAQPLAVGDMWTRIAARPMAFEAPSAGFAVDWRTVATWRHRGISFATITHAAGLSSTGDPALDRWFPVDEPYNVPEATTAAISRAKSRGGRVAAVGTTVVRALESATDENGMVAAGDGVATARIDGNTSLRIVDAILSGIHQPGESHYDLLRAFLDDDLLRRVTAALEAGGYRAHEFGDSVLVERPPQQRRAIWADGRGQRSPAALATPA